MVVVAVAVFIPQVIGQGLAQVEAVTEPQISVPDDQLDQTPVAEVVDKDIRLIIPVALEALE
jgi:hypothetical protein